MIGQSHRARPPAGRDPEEAAAVPDLRALFETHYGSIWRLLRRLGVRPAQLDDAAQEVFWAAARRLRDITPGREHSFLYGVAIRVAANEARRQSSAMPLAALADVPALADDRPSVETLLVAREARALLDQALDRLPLDLRAVLVLHELEGLELKRIAEIEGIPPGTASSRLRRAREEFSAIARRIRASLTAQETRRER
jgi:RNA polymerase sigma-70 factor (ECF subfamily)